MADADSTGLPESAPDRPDTVVMPGRLIEMRAIGLISDLFRYYEARPEFMAALLQLYNDNGPILRFANATLLEIRRQYAGWYERQFVINYPPIPFGAGKYEALDSWHALLERQSGPRPRIHIQRYTTAVRAIAATWFTATHWGPEIVHASLVVWLGESAWRGRRLSAGGGSGTGIPVQALNLVVQFDPDGHTWGQVREWVLRDAKHQFDDIMSKVRASETRSGRSERVIPRRSRRRQATADESTRLRDLRWLFMTLAPDPVLNRPLSAHEVFDREPGSELTLSAVEKALSSLRRDLDL